MRWLGRGLLIIILLGILVSLYPKIPTSLWSPFSSDAENRELPEETRATTVYWLSQQDWLRYSIQGRSDLFRILSHAQLEAKQYKPEDEVQFGVRYRILDAEERILKEKNYFFRTKVLSPRELPDGRTFPARFYAESDYTASAGQVLFIDLRAHPAAAMIELKAIELPPGGRRIGVRAAQRQTIEDKTAALKWQRLKEETRAEMVDAHVYPHHLVTRFEILNLMSRDWMPLGPAGIEGESFLSDNLYLLDAEPSPAPESAITPSGLQASPSSWVTLPIAGTEKQSYRLEFTPLADNAAPVTIGLNHQANTDLEVNHYTARNSQGGVFTWSAELTPGLLQIIPDQPVSIRLLDPQTGDDITPPKRYLSGFKTGPGQPVSYRLNPGTGSTQPLRLDFRAMDHPDLGRTVLPSRVTIQFRDEQERLLEELESSVSPPFGPYQRFASELENPLSESQSLYVRAPEAAASVKIASASPILTTLYSRVADMPLQRVLPAQKRPWEDFDNRLSSWFINQPINASELVRQKRKASIVWFFQPIELDPALEQGIYEWETLETQSPRPQRRVLFPHEMSSPIRESALPSLYRRIGKTPAKISLQASVPGTVLQPQLMFSRNTSSPTTVRVFRDGELWLERGIAGKRGRFALPPVEAGRYQIRVESDGDWFVNHSPSGQPYLQRLAYKLDGNGLTFTVDKRTPKEVVSVQLFSPPQKESYNVQVTVSGPQRKQGLQSDYTLQQREYTLTGHPDTTLDISSDGRNWSEPYRLVVPLGEDMPNGTYKITLKPASSSTALATAFRLLEGQNAPYRFFREVQSDP